MSSKENKKYVSVANRISAKLALEKRGYALPQVQGYLDGYRSQIALHTNKPDDGLNEEELKWLEELLCWEYLFPNEKRAFPGKRPHNLVKQKKVSTGYLLPCKTCLVEGKSGKDTRCPYVRLVGCDAKRGYEEFLVRLGLERFEPMGCPACATERVEEQKEGWVFA